MLFIIVISQWDSTCKWQFANYCKMVYETKLAKKLKGHFSLLHRPIFTKFFTPVEPLFSTTKQIVSPAATTRHRSHQIGAVLVLNGQMNSHIILIFRFLLISERGYQSRLGPFRPLVLKNRGPSNYFQDKIWFF